MSFSNNEAPTPIPGFDVLGCGYDVFGEYSASAKLRPLFDMRAYDPQPVRYLDREYLIPVNATVDLSPTESTRSLAFSSREDAETYFSGQAGISTSYGFFSGEFDTLYSQTVRSDSEYDYGLVNDSRSLWRLDLRDRSAGQLAQSVKEDPDYQNLPERFSEGDLHLYSAFFEKYGTHYVTGLEAGARLYYAVSLMKSDGYSQEQVQSQLSLEYHGLFARTEAQAQASWSQVDQHWVASRSVTLRVAGGDTSLLAGLVAPGWGMYEGDAYQHWSASVDRAPAVVRIFLDGVDRLFSGEKAEGVRQAMQVYTGTRLYVESKTGSCLISYGGRTVLRALATQGELGFQLAVVNLNTRRLEGQWAMSTQDASWDDMCRTAWEKLQPFQTTEYLIAFTTWAMFAWLYPQSPFLEVLESCGAGGGLDRWIALNGLTGKGANGQVCNSVHLNYVLLGVPETERGEGLERFERAGSCDTGQEPWAPLVDGWNGKPAPAATVEAELYRFPGEKLHRVVATRSAGELTPA